MFLQPLAHAFDLSEVLDRVMEKGLFGRENLA